MKIFERERLERALDGLDLVPIIEEGFMALSSGQAVVPPVGELKLEKGEVHIQYGFIRGQAHYVIKIASGFYGNAALGLPSGNGRLLLFEQETGRPVAALLDEGHLTDVRTAIAGAIGAQHLAARPIRRIGVFGTGVPARLQVHLLRWVTECRSVFVWGRRRWAASESGEASQARAGRRAARRCRCRWSRRFRRVSSLDVTAPER